MILWVAESLQELSDETIVSVADADQERQVRRLLPGAVFVRDAVKDRGPIEGFARGFQAARGDLVLVAPCDAPLLKASLYALLLEKLGAHDAAVPRLDVADPIRAVYRKEPVVRALAHHGGSITSPSALVDRLDAIFVEPQSLEKADPQLSSFSDVNREADLTRLTASREDDLSRGAR